MRLEQLIVATNQLIEQRQSIKYYQSNVDTPINQLNNNCNAGNQSTSKYQSTKHDKGQKYRNYPFAGRACPRYPTEKNEA